ncbi:Uma2 family endonuclease [Desulfoferrobacter suflitae]|uniref:Uma2 family endonuclease n=1 Tax=Desulfoferrobacter suflitae TaxID=2865782 RepID=UPI0021648206|nr:Uma2 family endonuclease [Desulfoferrobacter suflitae]MCK8601862.1 Uma2 family endonuclease [Desulfoferrobacter suflitae]
MTDLAKKRVVYENLFDIPDNMTGEIINGELIATPRPSRKHSVVISRVGFELGPPYDFGRGGGPGGWVIVDEPEISFGENILVPDMAGWKKERFPVEEPHNWISVAPDWVCEILSPTTVQVDRAEKMPIYAQHHVLHAWLIDPIVKTLELFRLESGRWVLLGVYAQSARVHAEPFPEIELDLGLLWLE